MFCPFCSGLLRLGGCHRLTVDEVVNRRDDGAGDFFHEPVTGMWDDQLGDVGGASVLRVAFRKREVQS